MADLGFLNFGIGVDGEDLLAKALEKDLQKALELQSIISSIKLDNIDFGSIYKIISKNEQASAKLGEARDK
ncbi:MAG: hypothetical protein RR319_01355, partial [Bacteroides sp.]